MKKKIVNKDDLIINGDIEDKGMVVNLDIGKFYQFGQEEFEINVTDVHYSNQSFIQITGQDVFVDFLQMPGIKKEGKMIANSTRIFMTHVQAKKLAQALTNLLEKSYEAGRIENYK
jgi:hypothetical protein